MVREYTVDDTSMPNVYIGVDVYYRKYKAADCSAPLYGWTAIDVPKSELYANFDLFVGEIDGVSGFKQLLDAGNYYNIITASALGMDL